MIRVMLFDRFDQPLGELSENEVYALVRSERVNGEHSLKITTTRVLQQGQRILTCDSRGKWREHVVYGTDALHDSGDKPYGEYYCVWSLQPDLMGTRVSAMPGVQNPCTAAVALAAAIGGTARWAVGTVTNQNTGGASMYDTDGWSALSTLINVWGGELDATIEVGSNGVTARKVDLYSLQGDQEPKRRYDFGADIKSVRRKIADSPLYCRMTPRGMGEETENGGYGRRITIESVNDGKDYLVNDAMVDLAKLPNGSGGWEYPTIEAENPDIQTPAELLAWAQSVLDDYTVPKITYTVDVLQLASEGVDMHGVSLGDAVQIVDRRFGDGLRVQGRVLQETVDMLNDADMQVTIGSIAGDLAGLFGKLDAQISTVTNVVQTINGGTMDAAGYLERLIERINTEINATGGYTYITQGQGIRTYDTAVSDPLVGAEASKVVEVKGGTIRIANSKTAQGAWEWKTVFASGLVASEVMSASNIITGALTVRDANQNAIFVADMDAGTVSMAGDAITIGQRTLAEATGTVYGTFQYVPQPDSTNRYMVACEPFEPSDDTILKVKWLSNTSYNYSYPPAIWINGSKLPQNYGSNFRLPSDKQLQKNKVIVMEVEHYDENNPSYWRWVVTAVEDETASEGNASRTMFARDTSEIEINGGKVTFNAGTFVVNADDFKVDEDGVITATAGRVGGMNLANSHIYNDSLDLKGTGLEFLYDENLVGMLQPQYLEDAQHNLVGALYLQVPYDFHMASLLPGASGLPTAFLVYSKDPQSVSAKGIMTVSCDVNLTGAVNIAGARIDSAFDEGITGAVVTMRENNTRYVMEFTNGILTDYYPA